MRVQPKATHRLWLYVCDWHPFTHKPAVSTSSQASRVCRRRNCWRPNPTSVWLVDNPKPHWPFFQLPCQPSHGCFLSRLSILCSETKVNTTAEEKWHLGAGIGSISIASRTIYIQDKIGQAVDIMRICLPSLEHNHTQPTRHSSMVSAANEHIFCTLYPTFQTV